MIATALPHDVDVAVSVSGVDVEIHTYKQSSPFKGVFEAETHTLSMSLTPQVSYSRCCYLAADGSPGPWVQAGDIMFTPRGKRLMLVSPGGAESYRGIYCSFASHLFEQKTGLNGDWSAEQLLATLNVRAPQIKRDLYRIVKEISESGFARESLIESAANIVLVELARFLRQVSLPAQPVRSSLAAWQLRRITDYVEGMIDHSPSIYELARLCEIGPRHLARAFKASSGRTIGEYVREVRMTKAKSLLADTDLTQKEIAYRLGFSGPSSFCAVFGKEISMTPKQFRERHRR
jgi:AraC family transcriptional regulator